jgi:hypothetical protein
LPQAPLKRTARPFAASAFTNKKYLPVNHSGKTPALKFFDQRTFGVLPVSHVEYSKEDALFGERLSLGQTKFNMP